jgi:GH15 family glucan-1,4-alpha-glucosidase
MAAIEDYALLGDCESAALVSRAGSVDWLCWPRFDSAACCAALLGGPEHGCWTLSPTDFEASIKRRYRPDTLILETEFTTSDGVVTLIDFMPVGDRHSHLIRVVFGMSGKVTMHTQLILRFDFGSLVPWVTRLEDGRHSFAAGPHRAILHTPVQLRGEGLKTVGKFSIRAGQTVAFVLSYTPWHQPAPRQVDPAAALRVTERFWRRWLAQGSDAGEYTDAVRRSLITLKALTYRSSGGILAAPTTSLPENIGGSRNWDYRYCWVRDATFTLQAMMNTGHYAEAQQWRAWLLRAAAGDPAKMQTLYGVAGERLLPEWEISWLPGYEHSTPVRIGNAASEQLQLDVFGEIMEVLYHARRGRLAGSQAGWTLQTLLLEHLEQIWSAPDHGIWETRDKPRHFTHSKVMAWVALDRAIRSAEQFRLPGPLRRWRSLRQRIHEDVCHRGFNRKVGAFVRSYGSQELDASILLLPLVGFLPVSDPRMRSTVEAIERSLLRDGLVRRYEPSAKNDGFREGEGAFLACSFWLADNYVLLDRCDDARRLFERLLALRNDVGLLSEEYDPTASRLVGNFPQSFSHIALINTAHNLVRESGPAKQRASPLRRALRTRGRVIQRHGGSRRGKAET